MILLFQVMVMMLCLLLISTQIVTKRSDKDYHPVAQYLVTLTWDDARNVDLDLWLRDPFGHIIFYNNRESSNISLDRDSRGYLTNQTTLPDGTVLNSGNREIISIRAILPGDYLVSVGYYDGVGAIDATVLVEKVNPSLSTVAGGKVNLKLAKQSANVVAFHVAPDGRVTRLPLPPRTLIEEQEHP